MKIGGIVFKLWPVMALMQVHMTSDLLMLCELLGLDLAFGSVTPESESVLHSMSLSVTNILFFLLYTIMK